MDAFKAQGAFSWSELIASDADAALGFYTTLLGWKSAKMSMPGFDYHVLKVGDTAVGGVMTMPQKGKPAWGCYVTVDDVDAVARRAAELGGKVIDAPRDVPGVGRSAVIADPQGATLNVITYAAPAS